jgi:hypothetical protein
MLALCWIIFAFTVNFMLGVVLFHEFDLNSGTVGICRIICFLVTVGFGKP